MNVRLNDGTPYLRPVRKAQHPRNVGKRQVCRGRGQEVGAAAPRLRTGVGTVETAEEFATRKSGVCTRLILGRLLRGRSNRLDV